MVVVEPSGKAFDAAFGLRPIGHFRGDVGQLRAFAAHDAADERRQGGEVAGEVACGRSRIGLREGVADGMIARSEEHTSELQSQSNLVCRLLLEKKKTRINSNIWRLTTIRRLSACNPYADTATFSSWICESSPPYTSMCNRCINTRSCARHMTTH